MIKAIIGMTLIYFLGLWWGWSIARGHYYNWYVEELKLRDKKHQREVESMKQCFIGDLNNLAKEKDIERQDLSNQYVRILDEVSKATGIDKVELPSFGTVYINHSEKLRAAMRELNLED